MEPIHGRLLKRFIMVYTESRKHQFKRWRWKNDYPKTQDLMLSVQRQVKIYRSQNTHTICKACRTELNSIVKIYIAEWSSSKFDQDLSSHVLKFYIVCSSFKFRSIQQLSHEIAGCSERTWICRNMKLTTEEVQLMWQTLPSASSSIRSCSELLERNNFRIFRWKDHVYVQRHCMLTKKGNTETRL